MSYPVPGKWGIVVNPLIFSPFDTNNSGDDVFSNNIFLLMDTEYFLLMDGENFLLEGN